MLHRQHKLARKPVKRCYDSIMEEMRKRVLIVSVFLFRKEFYEKRRFCFAGY